MKYKTTNKAVNGGYSKVIRIGYCNAQHLLRFQNPVAYTCGVDGWKSDIYAYGPYAISTGYQPTGDICPKYDMVREYDVAAEKILCRTDLSVDEMRTQVNELLDMLMEEVVMSA